MTEPTTVTRGHTRTTCPYCGVGCGIIADINDRGGIGIKGDPDHPANHGRLCSKGSALNETLDLEDRLLYPEINGVRCDWNAALQRVAGTIERSIGEHGRESVAFYVSGQLLTEDYYVANKLMKGFIGTANIDTNSRLCMASAVAGYKRAFGSDTVPCDYTDLEAADLLVLTGSNTAWCHPVIYQRMVRAKKNNPALRVINIDPRRTATCEIADLHLQLRPGSDITLFNGLLGYLHEKDLLDCGFISQHTDGLDKALARARENAPTIAAVALDCGLNSAAVGEFYRLFGVTDKTVTLFSQGVNQSRAGTDKVNAIINCHLATGRIGKPGTGPFSITGQPNAMGGREVGGLANQLAAHMSLEDPQHRDYVRRFWNSPLIADRPGPMTVELFDAVHRGEIKTLWIMATNPVVSLPDADRVRDALRRCDNVIVSDCIRLTDTTAEADILLPAQTWSEKDGTVTNSERRISRQRRFLQPPGEARPDWWIICEVAKRLGYAREFSYAGPADIFREHAALSGFNNKLERDFDISALADLAPELYDQLQPVQWPLPSGRQQQSKLFSDGRFFTPDNRARFIPVSAVAKTHDTNTAYPLILNTGRVRDHWHTMTRTGKSPRLSQHQIAPVLEIHPGDAGASGLEDNRLARVESRWGAIVARTHITDSQRPGCVFVPMHWNDQFASNARIDRVVNPVTDPVSGQPESKHTPIRVPPVHITWEGILLTRKRLPAKVSDYWVCGRCEGLWSYELAGENIHSDCPAWARKLLPGAMPHAQWLEYSDPALGRFSAACIANDRLECCVFVAPRREHLPDRPWLQELFACDCVDQHQRSALLAGRPFGPRKNPGPVVCSCFAVRRNTILDAIQANDFRDTESLGEYLQAGTNCGSCLPELKNLIQSCRSDTSNAA